MKSFQTRSYELGCDPPFVQCTDNEVGNLLFVVNGKRCADMLNVPILIKRVRTASRQRVPSHVNAETSGCVHAPIKTDTFSEDTTSFQDDHSTLKGGLHTPNTLEVGSLRDFDKQMLDDSAEISHKPKRKETKIMLVFFPLDI